MKRASKEIKNAKAQTWQSGCLGHRAGCMSMSFGYALAGDKQEKKCHFANSWKRTMVP
jgi:hypothetical protein